MRRDTASMLATLGGLPDGGPPEPEPASVGMLRVDALRAGGGGGGTSFPVGVDVECVCWW